MAADGEPHEDRGGSDGSDSSDSNSSPSPCPQPALSAAPATAANAAASQPIHPHLYHQPLHPPPTRPPHVANSEPPPSAAPERPFREDCWSENATFTLIQAWGDRYLELNRGNLKQKHWKDVADCVNSRLLSSSKPPKTDVQCKNRLDTLKKKYKIEKSKLVTGGAPSKWAFFDRLDELIGSSKKNKAQSSGKISRSAALSTDGNCTNNPDAAQVMSTPFVKCAAEEDVKPPLFFIPPQAPPPLSHHVGGVVVHMNHHLGNVLHLNHHVGAPLIHHLASEGAHINHLAGMPNYHLAGIAAGTGAVNHQVHDGGDAAAADTASKSKAGPGISQSSLPQKRLASKRRFKRKWDGHRSNEDGPFRELAKAICKFGDVYERVELAKLEQATSLEKQRRELIKDLEIQRMKMFAQMQIEHAKMKYGSNEHSNAEDHL
ncbi:hypothetical protein GOP47_0017953 [Adiantum capillus-veneris]|uniref:Myb/SANT-like DNA-binding domain-containing protein n=1 Tax=Adiantum capillus-veneris TaxID=13818 RepID=A0A9D4UGL1_ADICA|nr:hypothetical protein GOP47_0017953 [Adiantum capillus-veneris]